MKILIYNISLLFFFLLTTDLSYSKCIGYLENSDKAKYENEPFSPPLLDYETFVFKRVPPEINKDITEASEILFLDLPKNSSVTELEYWSEAKILEEIKHEEGYEKIYRGIKRNKTVFIFAGLTGLTRFEHWKLMLKLLCIEEKKIKLVRTGFEQERKTIIVNYVKKAFEDIKPGNRIAQIGWCDTTAFTIKTFYPSATLVETRIIEEDERTKIDLIDFPRDGEKARLIVFKNVFGDQVETLIEAINLIKPSHLLYFGIAGSTVTNAEVTQYHIPSGIMNYQGKITRIRENPIINELKKSLKDKLIESGTSVSVRSPLVETQEWLDKMREEKVNTVEMELNFVAEKLSKEIEFTPFLIISDIVGVEDLGKWDKMQFQVKNVIFPEIYKSIAKITGLN